MKTKKTTMATVVLAVLLSSCATHYHMDSIERTRVLIDKSYDNTSVKAAEEFIAPFKAEVDRQMSPVVGKVANYLYAKKPESPRPAQPSFLRCCRPRSRVFRRTSPMPTSAYR